MLVNNVGAVSTRLDGFLAITDEQWTRSLNLTLMAAVRMTGRCSRRCWPPAGQHRDGQLGQRVPADPNVLDYSAAKAALTNFSKSLSKEVGGRGVRVNTVVRDR